MIKRVLGFLFLALGICSLNGCGGSSGGGPATPFSDPLTTEDLAAVEAVLLADRVEAAQSLSVSPTLAVAPVAASVVEAEAETGEAPFQRRDRAYLRRRLQNGWQVRRADGSCPVAVEPGQAGWRVLAGAESCTAARLEDSSLVITRGNGTQITVGQIPAEGGTTSLTIGTTPWQVVFDTGDGPLATLTNTRSGRVLTVTESAAGELTVIPSGGSAFPGRWTAEGEITCSDPGSGRQYRYRGGR